jgi:activator of HSP90 ATPase
MTQESIRMSAVLQATPARIYAAWLSSKGHTAMTESPATASARLGGKFTAWDGYISGKNLELERDKRIVQSWRSTEFPKEAPDSRLEVIIEETARGTRITLKHTGIPRGQASGYRQGWKDYYFEPMRRHFASR